MKFFDMFKSPKEEIKITATALNVAEFPKNLFSVYFEVFLEPVQDQFYAQVRFISRDTHEKVETLEYYNSSISDLEVLVAQGVREVMSKYTR